MNTADAYHEALSSHRHYDSMANASLSLLGAVIAGTPALYGATKANGAQAVFLLGVVIIWLCVLTYKRFDRYAAIALNVAAAMEDGDSRFVGKTIGFAAVFRDVRQYSDLDATGESRTYKRIRAVAALIALAFTAVFVVLSIPPR